MRDLVTGASSGLGKFLVSQTGAIPGTRETLPKILESNQSFDRIIHCAAVSHFETSTEEFQNSNIDLTAKLLDVPHRRFIFMSTCDVYPDDSSQLFSEDFPLSKGLVGYRSTYAWSKAQAEIFVLNKGRRPLVLRLSALLDPSGQKQGTALRLVKNGDLRVCRGSVLDCIPYSLVEAVVCHQDEPEGIINVASAEPYKIVDAEKDFRFRGHFGTFFYACSKVKVSRLKALLGVAPSTTFEYLTEYKSAVGGG